MRIPAAMGAVLGAALLACPAPAQTRPDQPATIPAPPVRVLPRVELVEPGAEPREALRYAPEAGATETSTLRMRYQQSMGVASPVMVVTVQTDVASVGDDGKVTASFEYTHADIAEAENVNPIIAEQTRGALKGVVGVNGELTMNSRGIIVDSTSRLAPGGDPRLAQQVKNIVDQLQQIMLPLPEEAVGVGAKWRTTSQITTQGLTITEVLTCTLAAREGDRLEIDATFDQSAPEQRVETGGQSMLVKGVEGSGEATYEQSLGRVTPVSASRRAEVTVTVEMPMPGRDPDGGEPMVVAQRTTIQLDVDAGSAQPAATQPAP